MVHLWREILWWIEVHTGTTNEPGPYYGFFSGFGSDIGEIVLIGAVVQVYRKHNCHLNKCWRIAHHKFTDNENGTDYMLCKKHYRVVHPESPEVLKMKHILHIHRKNQENTY